MTSISMPLTAGLGTPLLRETCSHLKPTDCNSHTSLYTYHERVALVQAQVSSERTLATGCAEQASQTPHQDETMRVFIRWFTCPPS